VSKETTSSVSNATSTLNCAGNGMPTIVLSGCNFAGCSLAFSGPASNVNNSNAVVEDVLKDVNISDIFDD